MSAALISSPPLRSVEHLPPLPTKEAEQMMDPVPGGYFVYRDLAQRAIDLKGLEKQMDIELKTGANPRAWAIAKCVGAALLVAGAALLAFVLITQIFPLGAIAAEGLAMYHFASVLPLIGSICLFAVVLGNAIEVFKRPSLQQVQAFLKQISNESIDSENAREMAQVVEALGKKLKELEDDPSVQVLMAKARGKSLSEEELQVQKERITTALEQVKALKDWVDGIATSTSADEEASSA